LHCAGKGIHGGLGQYKVRQLATVSNVSSAASAIGERPCWSMGNSRQNFKLIQAENLAQQFPFCNVTLTSHLLGPTYARITIYISLE